jgi:hypothetical protein
MDRRILPVLLAALFGACAPPKPEPFHYREGEDARDMPEPVAGEPTPMPTGDGPESTPTGAAAAAPATPPTELAVATDRGGEALGSLRYAPPLPAELDAGAIPRPDLAAVLTEGIPRFLQKVHTEPMLNAKGRFVGWRLLELFPNDPRGAAWVIRPGDVVLKVNGHGIERPEQFQNVWNSMASSSELVFLVLRGDQTSEIRYRIE